MLFQCRKHVVLLIFITTLKSLHSIKWHESCYIKSLHIARNIGSRRSHPKDHLLSQVVNNSEAHTQPNFLWANVSIPKLLFLVQWRFFLIQFSKNGNKSQVSNSWNNITTSISFQSKFREIEILYIQIITKHT